MPRHFSIRQENRFPYLLFKNLVVFLINPVMLDPPLIDPAHLWLRDILLIPILRLSLIQQIRTLGYVESVTISCRVHYRVVIAATLPKRVLFLVWAAKFIRIQRKSILQVFGGVADSRFFQCLIKLEFPDWILIIVVDVAF